MVNFATLNLCQLREYVLGRRYGAQRYRLAPWQRGFVWTRGQQEALWDSMLRGWSCPALVIWNRYGGDGPMILDGQQRISTLLGLRLDDPTQLAPLTWFYDGGFYDQQGPDRHDPIHANPLSALLTDSHARQALPRLAYPGGCGEVPEVCVIELDVELDEAAEIYLRHSRGGTPHTRGDLAKVRRALHKAA